MNNIILKELNPKTMKEASLNFFEKTDDNIISVGYGFKRVSGVLTDERSVIFGVENKTPISELDPSQVIPDYVTVDNNLVKTDVVRVNKIKTMADCASTSFYSWRGSPTPNQGVIRPIEGGVSAINTTELYNYACTMGFLAEDKTDKRIVGVSNTHCAGAVQYFPSEHDYTGVYAANEVSQPSIPDDSNPYSDDPFRLVGFVKRKVPLLKPPSTNLVDAAIYSLNEAVIDSGNAYKIVGLNLTGKSPFATSAEISQLLTNVNGALVDPKLYSSGRTTGPKGEGDIELKISQVDVTLEVFGYGEFGDDSIIFTDCISYIAVPSGAQRPFSLICDSPIEGGDSGSAVLADFSGTKKILGLAFAGSVMEGEYWSTEGYMCSIDNVVSKACIKQL